MTHKQLVAAFEIRYDYHSARTLLAEALEGAKLDSQSEYEAKHINALLKAIPRVTHGSEAISERIRELAREEKSAAKEAPKPAGKPTAKKKKS